MAFPKGLVLVGELGPDTEYQSREDRAAGKPVRQRVNEATGLRQWKGTFTDPSAEKERDTTVTVTFLAEVQPVPTTPELLPGTGMRMVELDGLAVVPRVVGSGEFKTQGWSYYATGFKATGAAGGAAAGRAGGAGSKPAEKPDGKAA